MQETKTKETQIKGTVIKGVGGLYTVRPDDGREDIRCKARGVFRYENITLLVGDRVTVVTDSEEGESGFVIDKIEERKNSLIRPAIANLSHLFIIVPSAKPKPDLLTVDKLISIADSKGIEPVVIVNKLDLDPEEATRIKTVYEKVGFNCFLLSAATGEGCEALYDFFVNESEKGIMLSAFAGASAAGKSTLLTRLFPALDLKTGEVSRKTQRGRHTTRHTEVFSVFENNRCFIADTPGFSLLDFNRFNFYDLKELPYAFREFRESLGECRYTKCTHLKEEGCAVLERVENGEIPKERHESYCLLYEEIKQKPEWKRRKEEKL
ncbi:MAG: ribosome small subunit-dependent GTPase A [Ruminococcaceae bacterium]|nr:ribosome small subunit-dependent GTPase A [Oscillospiraceae bacterium]